MSTLWKVSVIEKKENSIDLKVVLDHPDAGPFPDDVVFALCLLTSEAYKFDDDEQVANCALGESITHEKSYQPYDVESRVGEFIEKILIYSACNLPWDEDEAHAAVNAKVTAKGIQEESDEWEDEWEDEWGEYWNNQSNFPIAKYRIWVTDPKWIEHLKKGMSFETASYSENGPWVNENREVVI